MYPNDEELVALEVVKQLSPPLISSVVSNQAGQMLGFHLFLDAATDDTSGLRNSTTDSQLRALLFASYPDFQRLYDEPWSSDPTIRASATRNGASIQGIAGGNGGYKFDEYSIDVAKVPPTLTPQDYLAKMAADMNAAVNDREFADLSRFTRRITSRAPALGDIYDIDVGLPAPSPVMLVSRTASNFVFQTLRGHVEYGAREFGFSLLPDGGTRFFTRGVSRGGNLPGGVAGEADALQVRAWTRFIFGVCAEMNRLGGRCDPNRGQQPWKRTLTLTGNPPPGKPSQPPKLTSTSATSDPLTVGVSALFSYLNSRERIGLPPDRGAGFSIISHVVERSMVAGHPLGPSDVAPASASGAHVIAEFLEPLAVESDAAPGGTIIHNFTGQFEIANLSATYTDEALTPADAANGVSAQGSVNISYIDRARASASARWSEWTDDSVTVSVRIVHGKASTNLLGWPPSAVGPVVQAECTQMRSPDCIAITDTSP